MESLFGPVTPIFIASLVTIGTNLVKARFKLEGIKAALSAILVAIPTIPYYIITKLLEMRDAGFAPEALDYAFLGMNAFFYWIGVGFLAAGIYSVGNAAIEEIQRKKADAE